MNFSPTKNELYTHKLRLFLQKRKKDKRYYDLLKKVTLFGIYSSKSLIGKADIDFIAILIKTYYTAHTITVQDEKRPFLTDIRTITALLCEILLYSDIELRIENRALLITTYISPNKNSLMLIKKLCGSVLRLNGIYGIIIPEKSEQEKADYPKNSDNPLEIIKIMLQEKI